jgi:hypothetical protein
MKYALALFLLATACAVGKAEVPTNARVSNPGGYCCWACLETLGRMNDIPELFDLLKDRKSDPDDYFLDLRNFKYVPIPKNIGDERSLRKKLKSLHIKHEMQHTGDFDRRLLGNANQQGVLVTVEDHGIVLTRYSEDEVEYYDPNDGKMHIKSNGWFHEKWTGMVISLQK